MGQLVAILLLITITPNGSKIDHVAELTGGYSDRQAIMRACEMSAAKLNVKLDLEKNIYVCRQVKIFPQGTEHL